MNNASPTIAIIGGGLSGLAAAVAATEQGFRVELFEQAKSLGGRASSFVDSTTGQRIDHCRHVAMGCCTSFLDFCRRTGIDDCFERTHTLHFFGPEGDRHDFAPSRWLPAPLHLLPGLMRLKYLSLRERWSIVKTLGKLKSLRSHETLDEETVGAWLRRQGQSDRALERFWSVVLVSALGETLDHASLAAARKVFQDGFLASRGASDLLLPRLTLGEIFHDRLGRWLEDHGVKVHLGAQVKTIEGDPLRVHSVVLADGTSRKFDFFVLAVHWRMAPLLPADNLQAALPSLENIERIKPAEITAVHLWFDRPITPLPHAVLVGRLGQWVFTKENYCQVVISASHRLPERGYDELFDDVRRELEEVFPEAFAGSRGTEDVFADKLDNDGKPLAKTTSAPIPNGVGAVVELPPPRLLHGRVISQPSAVFSMQPGLDRFRPAQQTPIENLALAGDWTATGWPGTMEGAVRSGFRAVEILRKVPSPSGRGLG